LNGSYVREGGWHNRSSVLRAATVSPVNTIGKARLRPRTRSGLLDTHPKRPTVGVAAVRAPQGSGANGLPLERRAPYLFSASVVFVAQTASLSVSASVSAEIVAPRDDFS